MPRWRPARGRKKPEANRARQIGCIVWLVLAMGFVMLLFWAVFRQA